MAWSVTPVRWLRTLAVACAVAGPAAAQSELRPIDNLLIPATIPRTPVGTLGHVEILGSGRVPLILIPGGPHTWEVWRGFAQRNAARYTMYAVTLQGYGGTAVPALGASDSIEGRAWTSGVITALRRLIETRELDRPVIVANHLMAAYYAVRLASEVECRIGGIVAIASDPISGDALRYAVLRSPAERREGLHERWIPFFRSVDSTTWSRGAFQPAALSDDSARAAALFRAQMATPLYTQIRYYLEYLSDDLGPELRALRVPMLSLVPRFNSAVLPDSVRQRLVARWGSPLAAEDSLTYNAFWARRFGLTVPSLEMRVLPSKAAVVMDDQPAWIDAAVAEFVAKRRTCRSPS
jgi:pimeloyl-ACP methyl ester carboxylesterase